MCRPFIIRGDVHMTGEGHYPSLLLALGGPKVCLPEAAGPDVNTAS